VNHGQFQNMHTEQVHLRNAAGKVLNHDNFHIALTVTIDTKIKILMIILLVICSCVNYRFYNQLIYFFLYEIKLMRNDDKSIKNK
jgi:hypothetical protein